MTNLKLTPGDLAEYYLPNREDLSTLYSIRSVIFNAISMQQVLDKVQSEINEILKSENKTKELKI
tara:strand:- start:269 stop:463 length:195 start_codon:yes stop_codon:yes gene_type:complete